MLRGIAIVALATALAHPSTAVHEVEVIGATGEQAPLLPAGVTLSLIHEDAQNHQGQLAFSASTSQGAVLWGPGVDGELAVLAQAGDPAPGAPVGAVFQSFGAIQLNEGGEVAFYASLAIGPGGVTSSDASGIWGPDGAGGFTLVLREGDPAPGISPTAPLTDDFWIRGLNDAGYLVVENRVVPHALHAFFGADPGGAAQLLLASGDPIPGMPGDFFTYPVFGSSIDGAGNLVFLGRINGFTADFDHLILELSPGGSLSVLAAPGDSLPQVPGAVLDSVDGFVRANDAGIHNFSAGLEIGPGGVTLDDDRLHAIRGPGGLDLAIREGATAPDIAGAVPIDILSVAGIAPAGHLALVGRLGSVSVLSDEVVYARPPGGPLRLVARQGASGSPIPAASGQLVANAFANSSGDVAVLLYDEPLGFPASLFFDWTGSGALETLGVGDTIEVAPGDTRQITGFAPVPLDREEGRLNDLRQLSIRANVTGGGNALLRVSAPPLPPAPPAVPGPGAPLLLALAAGLLLSARGGYPARSSA